MSSKLWGGRFEGVAHPDMEAFTSSLALDGRLWDADLTGSVAHVKSLFRAGVLSQAETTALVNGLELLREELRSGAVQIDPLAEDIHSEIERLLGERVGPVAGKLHTGRSRNDQVTTATRLYLRDQVKELDSELRRLQQWIVTTAESHLETLLPGLTHLQHGQPVTLAHHLLAYFWMLDRDRGRFSDALRRINSLPLGAGALAGTAFAIDRLAVARELGFDSLCENSLDAVSDRDFVVETLSHLSLVMIHLSRLSEELIRWASPEMRFVELADEMTTGSSLMPQKKNPDVAELIRGRSGRVVGSLMGALVLLKGLPLSYNRDLQEDKQHLFDALDTTRASVRLMLLLLEKTRFLTQNMARALEGDFSNATDLADFLVRRGMPFREAHGLVGQIVRSCLEQGVALESLTEERLRAFSPLLDGSAKEALAPLAVVKARACRGGTAPSAVSEQLKLAKEALK